MIEQICLTDAMLAAAKEVFETMVFMDIEESSEPDRQIQDDALLGSITFEGPLEGCLSFCCDAACAKTIATNMLGMEPDEEIGTADINDAIGEIANMLMGSVKKLLADSVGDLQVSIPTVVSGRGLESNLGDRASKTLIKVNIQDEYLAELSLLYRESGTE